jgi:hypothetical protein
MADAASRKRWRRRLIAAGVVVVLLAGCLGTAHWYVASGRLATWLCAQYARILPGQLTIGRVTLRGITELELHQVALGMPGHRPLATARLAVVSLDPGGPSMLQAVRVEGLKGWFDGINYNLLDRIVDAADYIPPSNPPASWDLATEDALVEVENGPSISGVYIKGHLVGALFALDCGGMIDGKPIKVGVSSEQAGPDARRITVDLVKAHGRIPQMLGGLEAMTLLPPVPPALVAWLPEAAVFDGSVVRCDMSNRRLGGTSPPVFRAEANLVWEGGGGKGRVVADQRRIQIEVQRFADRALGRAENLRVQWDNQARRLTATCPGAPGWHPGPRLPIPPEVPVDGLLQVMPAASVRYDLAAGREEFELVLSGREGAAGAAAGAESRLAFTWQPLGTLRLEGRELPLSLLRGLMPAWIEAAGQAAELRLVIDPAAPLGDGLKDVWVRFRQGRVSLGDWSCGPVDGEFALRPSGPLTRAPFAASATLARDGGGTLATATYSGTTTAGAITLDLPVLDALANRWRGPRLPRLKGALSAEAELAVGAETTATVRRLTLRGVSMGAPDAGGDMLRTLDADLRGTLVRRGAALAAKIGGHLRRGTVALGGMTIPLEADHPIFTLDGEVAVAGDAAGTVTLRELLVRAADDTGTPAADRFSGQFAGTISPEGDGSVRGVVDHADLGWVVGLSRRPGVRAAGEAAIACTARIQRWRRIEIDGSLLPLGIDLRVGNRFHASGITGAVHFTIVRDDDHP